MTTDPPDAFEEGERLILATDAREAGVAAVRAGLTYQSVVVSELVSAGLFLTLTMFGGSGVPLIAGVAVTGVVEIFPRRVRAELERAEALAEELAAVVDALDDRSDSVDDG